MELSLIAVFHRNYVRKERFFEILERKQSFLDQKVEVLKGVKKWTFFKGVSPWILSKNRTFFYGHTEIIEITEIISEKMVFDIVERKE